MPPGNGHETAILRASVIHVNTVLPSTGPMAGANFIPHPANPSRSYLSITNTGLTVGYFRFGQRCQSKAGGIANGDFPVVPGDTWIFNQVVPIDSLNLSCPDGATTFTTIEGKTVDPRLQIGNRPNG